MRVNAKGAFMEIKIPSKNVYSLKESLEYLSRIGGNHGLTIKDLLDFAYEGKLRTVIFLTGGRDFETSENNCRAKLFTLNNKQLDSVYYIKNESVEVIYDEIEISEVKNPLHHKEVKECEVGNSQLLNVYFQQIVKSNRTMSRYPYEKITLIKSYSERELLDNVEEFSFLGYFKIENSLYYGDREKIIDDGFIIKDFMSLFESIVENGTKLSFKLEPKKEKMIYRYGYPDLKISLDDIFILHDDLAKCFGFFKDNESEPLKEERLKQHLEYEGDLPEKTNADKLAEFIELIINPTLLENGKLPTYSKLYSKLDHTYRGKRSIPAKNTIKKYLNQ